MAERTRLRARPRCADTGLRGGGDLDAESRIRAYHADSAWLGDVCAYAGVTAADLVAGEAPPGSGTSAELRDAREIAFLERMAREPYKLRLHAEWLAALGTAIQPGRPFHVLDYGCGASSFSALALSFPEVHCTLAETSRALLGYLRWRAAQRSAGRLRVLDLPYEPNGYQGAARLRVDVNAVTGDFDAVVLADVLEHTLDPLRVLAHLLARLRPGGLAFVNYPYEIDGDWHTPEAFYQRRACFLLLRACCRWEQGRAWRRRAGLLPATALAIAGGAEPTLRSAARRFARRTFAQRGASLVARVREAAGRELDVAELIADV